MSKETNENRRRINQLLALAVGGGIVSAFADGYIWQESQENAGSQREITRGTYTADQLREIETCLEDRTDFEGIDETFGELLNEDEDRNLRELEYVFDETGPRSGVSSSIRYTVELEGGGTHELGWYQAQNSDVEILAEASTYDDLSNYEEENCR